LWPEAALIPQLGISGNTIYDASGHGRHGTLIGMDPGTDWVRGEKGLALEFSSGSNQYVTATGGGSIATGEELTISFWMKSTQYVNFYGVVYYFGGGTGYLFQLYSNTIRVVLPGYSQTINSASNPRDGAWHHILLTRSGTTCNLYFDLALDGTKTHADVDNLIPDAHFQLCSGSPDYNYSGQITGVMAWRHALNEGEREHIHRDPLAPFRLKPRIIALAGEAPPAGGHAGPLVGNEYLRSKLQGLVS